MIRAVLVTHGRLGESLMEVVEHFLGPQDAITVISNDHLSGAELRATVETEIELRDPGDHVLLFSDLKGGSCDAACRASAGRLEGCVSVSGVNLPMLLEFCHYRGRLDPDALLERVLFKAKDGVRAGPEDATPGGGDPGENR